MRKLDLAGTRHSKRRRPACPILLRSASRPGAAQVQPTGADAHTHPEPTTTMLQNARSGAARGGHADERTATQIGGSMCGPLRRVATLRDRWRSPAQLVQGVRGQSALATVPNAGSLRRPTGKGRRALRDGPGGSARSGPR